MMSAIDHLGCHISIKQKYANVTSLNKGSNLLDSVYQLPA